MEDILFNWYQALQLLALGPCVFVIYFLCISGRKVSLLVVPMLYFLTLACSFILPLLDVFPANIAVRGILVMGENTSPALSFLLILQFIRDRIPRIGYWTILAVPLLGGSSIIYSTLLVKGELCIYDQLCTTPVLFQQLYYIFSSSLTFLLTIFLYDRLANDMTGNTEQRQHKYALIMALVILNLALLGITLGEVTDNIIPLNGALTSTIVRIGFIYLVLTSMFRVFDRSFEIAYERVPHLRPTLPSIRDLLIADEIRTLLTRDKIQCDMELSRPKLAARLAITEHQLSRIINQCFAQNFSSLINHYRILDARERLEKSTSTSITAIAFEVGFSSIPSFNRVFKLATDMSPSEYRNHSKLALKS